MNKEMTAAEVVAQIEDGMTIGADTLKKLAQFDAIADLHFHGRLHANVIETYQGNRACRRRTGNLLPWPAGNRNFQPPLELYHSFSLFVTTA